MALLKYFSRESPLPNPLGPLSEVVSPEGIKAANKEVKAVQQSTREFHELDGGSKHGSIQHLVINATKCKRCGRHLLIAHRVWGAIDLATRDYIHGDH